MKEFDEWFKSMKFDGSGHRLYCDKEEEVLAYDAFKAGMLAAAHIAQNMDYTTFAHRDTQTAIAIGIREAVTEAQ